MGTLQKGGWVVAVAVGLSLAPQLWAGEKPDEAAPAEQKTTGASWLGPWFGAKEKPKASKAPASGKATKNAGPAAGKDGASEENSAERAREQATLLRRLAVCDQLRTVAARKQDDALMRRADALDERAWDIYTRRVARLPSGRAVTEPGTRPEEPVRESSVKLRGK
jgi:hypothetical protein